MSLPSWLRGFLMRDVPPEDDAAERARALRAVEGMDRARAVLESAGRLSRAELAEWEIARMKAVGADVETQLRRQIQADIETRMRRPPL